MSILNFITGQRNIDRMQKAGEDYGRAMYDPSQVDPLVDVARTEATQGIDTDSIRASMISETYRQAPSNQFGLSGGQTLASDMRTDQFRAGSVAQGEAQIGLADDEVRRQGGRALGEALAQRNTLKAQRDASVAESRLMAESEAGKRRMGFLGATLGLASAAINPSSIFKTISDMRSGGGGADVSLNMEGAGEVASNTLDTLRETRQSIWT